MRGEDPPTAIIFNNDAMALGGCKALIEMGVMPGRDVAVIVIVDTPLCRYFSPALTSFRPPLELLGRQARGDAARLDARLRRRGRCTHHSRSLADGAHPAGERSDSGRGTRLGIPHPRSGGGGPCEAWWRGRGQGCPTNPDTCDIVAMPCAPSTAFGGPLPRCAGEESAALSRVTQNGAASADSPASIRVSASSAVARPSTAALTASPTTTQASMPRVPKGRSS